MQLLNQSFVMHVPLFHVVSYHEHETTFHRIYPHAWHRCHFALVVRAFSTLSSQNPFYHMISVAMPFSTLLFRQLGAWHAPPPFRAVTPRSSSTNPPGYGSQHTIADLPAADTFGFWMSSMNCSSSCVMQQERFTFSRSC